MGIFRTVRPTPSVLAAALAVCAAAAPPAGLAALTALASPAAAAESPGPGASRPPAPGTPSTGQSGSPEVSVRVSPARVRPGTEIELWAVSCKGTVATARSEAFVADALLAPGADRGGLRGEAVIRSDAEPREYRITVECVGVKVTGRVTVHHSGSGPASGGPSHHATDPAVSPVAPVPAGGGGTAKAAGEEGGEAGPSALHTALGAGLAGTATLIVLWRAAALRRRSRSESDR
ncbi:hypothetical protein IQ279_11875 [Streptomyces verrucosisporus]|uniref:hypothetical protein n=1 Tax=Streptomyces verrucosisporus TaxID=1695161 RepID=UPI001F123EB2|nr:hypothetical protein [Streptomyces verrucosisporus]MBN3930325.1 hypothetical protein [Streptomyces verrucosisporus]